MIKMMVIPKQAMFSHMALCSERGSAMIAGVCSGSICRASLQLAASAGCDLLNNKLSSTQVLLPTWIECNSWCCKHGNVRRAGQLSNP